MKYLVGLVFTFHRWVALDILLIYKEKAPTNGLSDTDLVVSNERSGQVSFMQHYKAENNIVCHVISGFSKIEN